MKLLRNEQLSGRQDLRTILALWSDAAEAYSTGDFGVTIDKFLQVEDLSARMLYNMACAYTRLNKETLAKQCLSTAVKKDEHLAIAYFQKGTLNLKQNRLESAIADLSRANLLMRANSFVDYKPLGMICKLWKFEILYNLALAHLHSNHGNEAETLFTESLHFSDVRQRKLLISALENVQENRADLIPPVEVSMRNIFTPPKRVIDNMEKKSVMKSAKVVTAADKSDTDPGFNGKKRIEEIRRQSPPNTPLTKRSTENPLMKVKRFLLSQNIIPIKKSENPFPSGKMRTAHSTGDIRSLTNVTRNSESELCQELSAAVLKRQSYSRSDGDTDISTSSSGTSPYSSIEEVFQSETNPLDKPIRNVKSKRLNYNTNLHSQSKTLRSNSIEEVCSHSATCIARALSTNCDVTIVVSSPKTSSKEQSERMMTDQKLISNTRSSRENIKNKVTFTHDKDSTSETSVDIKSPVLKIVHDDRKTSPKFCRKPRPPPPSYPPPPLPPKTIFTAQFI